MEARGGRLNWLGGCPTGCLQRGRWPSPRGWEPIASLREGEKGERKRARPAAGGVGPAESAAPCRGSRCHLLGARPVLRTITERVSTNLAAACPNKYLISTTHSCVLSDRTITHLGIGEQGTRNKAHMQCVLASRRHCPSASQLPASARGGDLGLAMTRECMSTNIQASNTASITTTGLIPRNDVSIHLPAWTYKQYILVVDLLCD
jgi:hypothetical protein